MAAEPKEKLAVRQNINKCVFTTSRMQMII
jgi:hypothetical protein